MKVQPRALLAPRDITLPSGLKASVLRSPDIAKMVLMGKLPMPLIKQFQELTEAAEQTAETVSAESLRVAYEFKAHLVVGVVETIHYVDEDGTVYQLPLTLSAQDEAYPYDLLSADDTEFLYAYAQEGATALATFPDNADGARDGTSGEVLAPKTKRPARAKRPAV